MPDYFASAREAYKSLACRNLCTIMLLLLRPDTGPAVQILGNIGALQKYKFCDGNKGKKVQLSFVILRTKQIFSGPNFRASATNKGKLLRCLTEMPGYWTTYCIEFYRFEKHTFLVAAARRRSHQWCVSLTPSNTKTIGRMTCWPI